MAARRAIVLVTIPLLLAVLGCGSKPAGTAVLNLEQLRNASYPLLGLNPGAEARLVDGEFIDEEAHTRAILGEKWIARGDLDHDGREDVAVVIYFDTGGSGNFREFLVLTAHDGEPVVLGGVFAGDRIRVERFWIEAGMLTVELLTHTEDDPMCCPTLRVRDRYALQGGELIRHSRQELERVER